MEDAWFCRLPLPYAVLFRDADTFVRRLTSCPNRVAGLRIKVSTLEQPYAHANRGRRPGIGRIR